MTKKQRSRARGCVLSTIGFAFVGVVSIVTGVLWMTEGFREAERTGRHLDERFADRGPFVPPLDGSVPADRMALFLEVKANLQPYCAKFDSFYATLFEFNGLGLRAEESVVRKAFADSRARNWCESTDALELRIIVRSGLTFRTH